MTERNARLATVAGGTLVAVGALLPWASIGVFSVSGIQGDGLFALAFGIVIAAIGYVTLEAGPTRTQRVAVLILATLAALLYAWKVIAVSSIGADAGLLAPSIGSGLVVGLVGAVIAFAAGYRMGERATS